MCSAHTCCWNVDRVIVHHSYETVYSHMYYFCWFLEKSLYISLPQRAVCLLSLSSDYSISSVYFFVPHGRLCSSLYHIIMPKGVWACGHVHCFSVCLWEGLSEWFTYKKDTDKCKVCVHVCVCSTKCLWMCVWMWVCALLRVCCAHCQRGLSGRI